MAKRLEGKHILVTAAGQGIGKASVLALAAEGARVLATDVNEALLKVYQDVDGVSTRRLDVLDDGAVRSLIESMDRIDVLFNCAGYRPPGQHLRDHRRGLGLQLQPQRARHVEDDVRRAAPDA